MTSAWVVSMQALTSVLVEELNAIFGGDCTHAAHSFATARGSGRCDDLIGYGGVRHGDRGGNVQTARRHVRTDGGHGTRGDLRRVSQRGICTPMGVLRRSRVRLECFHQRRACTTIQLVAFSLELTNIKSRHVQLGKKRNQKNMKILIIGGVAGGGPLIRLQLEGAEAFT